MQYYRPAHLFYKYADQNNVSTYATGLISDCNVEDADWFRNYHHFMLFGISQLCEPLWQKDTNSFLAQYYNEHKHSIIGWFYLINIYLNKNPRKGWEALTLWKWRGCVYIKVIFSTVVTWVTIVSHFYFNVVLASSLFIIVVGITMCPRESFLAVDWFNPNVVCSLMATRV